MSCRDHAAVRDAETREEDLGFAAIRYDEW